MPIYGSYDPLVCVELGEGAVADGVDVDGAEFLQELGVGGEGLMGDGALAVLAEGEEPGDEVFADGD